MTTLNRATPWTVPFPDAGIPYCCPQLFRDNGTMLIATSQIVALAFGIAVCAVSVWGLSAPRKMWKLLNAVMDKSWGIWATALGRLIFGTVLIIAAPVSRYPQFFTVLGWLAIAAAVIIILMGRDRLRSFVAWFERLSSTTTRVWLLFALAFGAFLIYGIIVGYISLH